MLEFPALLMRCPLPDSFEDIVPDGRDFFAPDRGVALSRGDSAGMAKRIPWALRVDRARLQIFENFWRVDTKGGNLPFTMRHPNYDGAVLLDENFEPLLDLDDTPLRDSAVWIVKFADAAPRYPRLGSGKWRIAFELDILNG
jgi:hypothetical protein